MRVCLRCYIAHVCVLLLQVWSFGVCFLMCNIKGKCEVHVMLRVQWSLTKDLNICKYFVNNEMDELNFHSLTWLLSILPKGMGTCLCIVRDVLFQPDVAKQKLRECYMFWEYWNKVQVPYHRVSTHYIQCEKYNFSIYKVSEY